MTDPEDRAVFLSKECAALGASWVDGWCARLRRQGRIVEGGWPGTLPEAKFLVRSRLDSELAARGLRLLDNDEYVSATRATYERAKQEWRGFVRSSKRRRPTRNNSLDEVAT